MRCAVGNCKQNDFKKSTSGNPISFYRFPKDEAKRKFWVMFCKRKNTINAQNERICCLHFKQEDFERNFKFELGFSNRRAPKLKPGAVPTIETGDIPNESEAVICNEKTTPMKTGNDEDSSQLHVNTLEMKIAPLRQENDMLKMLQSPSAITIQSVSYKRIFAKIFDGSKEYWSK